MSEGNDRSVPELLTAAQAAGLRLRVVGTELEVRGPRAGLAQFLPALRAQKPALCRLLRAEPLGADRRIGACRWRCARCWRYFREADLYVVAEPLGRGFRCAACRRREG